MRHTYGAEDIDQSHGRDQITIKSTKLPTKIAEVVRLTISLVKDLDLPHNLAKIGRYRIDKANLSQVWLGMVS